MSKRSNAIKKGLKEVFQKPQYALLMLLIAVFFFVLNALLPNIRTLFSITPENEGIFILSLIRGGLNNMTTLSFSLLVIISILFGIVFSLLSYKVRKLKMSLMRDGKATTFGALLGLAAPGCASCGIGVLSAVGLTSVLAYLPFKGLEVGFLSIGLLVASTGSLATKIAEGDVCRVRFKKKQ